MFLIIFMWTPPHFWALALYRCRDYERAGVPMLPVVAGPARRAARSCSIRSCSCRSPSCPVFIGLGGVAYGAASVVLGAIFVWLAFDVWRITEGREADRAARRLFGFSILYLFVLFAVLLAERLVGLGVAA